MKIKKPIPTHTIPNITGGASRKKAYDDLVEKTLALPDGMSLVVECDSTLEALRIQGVMCKRDVRVDSKRRLLNVYLSKASDGGKD